MPSKCTKLLLMAGLGLLAGFVTAFAAFLQGSDANTILTRSIASGWLVVVFQWSILSVWDILAEERPTVSGELVRPSAK